MNIIFSQLKITDLLAPFISIFLVNLLSYPNQAFAHGSGTLANHCTTLESNTVTNCEKLLQQCIETTDNSGYCHYHIERCYDDFCVGRPHYIGTNFVALSQSPKPSCNRQGNPCDVITGRKIQTESDIELHHIKLTRHYDSGTGSPTTWIGAYWRHDFDTTLSTPSHTASNGSLIPIANVSPSNHSAPFHSKSQACARGWEQIREYSYRGILSDAQAKFNERKNTCEVTLSGKVVGVVPIFSLRPDIDSSATVIGHFAQGKINVGTYTISRPNGAFYTFEETTPNNFKEVNGYDVRLEKSGQDFLFYDTNGTVDRFVNKQMVERKLPNGQSLTLNYRSNGWLDSVSDAFGQSIKFHYNANGQIQTIAHANGQLHYRYDDNYNLVGVTYEDGATKQYHYENIDLPHHLTGITDGRGIRYATWTYDSEGKAISSMHANGVDNTTFEYTPTSTIVTDAPDPEVREIREKTGLSQTHFAAMIGVSKRTLENWEQGRRHPTGPARALLRIVEADPQNALRALHG